MKFSQKAKYFIFGAAVTTMAIPLTIKAVETIPTLFKEGDVISASVINDIFARINMVQRGFSSEEEISGIWMCKTYSGFNSDADACEKTSTGRLYKSGVVTFNGTTKVLSMQNVWPYNDCKPRNYSNNYELIAGTLFMGPPQHPSSLDVQMRSPTEIVLKSSETVIHCNKSDVAPAPPNELTAVSTEKSVTLNWINQGTNQAKIKIQRKFVEDLSVPGSFQTQFFVTVAEIDGTLTKYTDIVSQSGSYQYRIISSNEFGDSISSSIVAVTVN